MGKIFDIRSNDWLRKAKPQKSYLWVVELPDLKIPNKDEHREVSLRIISATIPFNSFENNKIPFGNSYQYTTRSVDIGALTLELLEMEDGKTVEYFLNWQQLMSPSVDPTKYKRQSVFAVPSKYKRQIVLYRMNEEKNNVIRFIYTGCFPLKISDSNNGYDTNDVVKHTVTFSVDSFTFQVLEQTP